METSGLESRYLASNCHKRTLIICGNSILIPQAVSSQLKFSQPVELAVIDWEFAQVNHRAYDVGGMIGDLCERALLVESKSAKAILCGFISGYGHVNSDMAFRVAMHVGVHLVCWYTRRAPNSPFPFSRLKIEALMTVARDFIVKAWERDTKWFRNSLLSALF